MVFLLKNVHKSTYKHSLNEITGRKQKSYVGNVKKKKNWSIRQKKRNIDPVSYLHKLKLKVVETQRRQ